MNPKVDFYFAKADKWQEEIKKLRTIVLDCGLNEELKWGCPCYTFPTGSSPSPKSVKAGSTIQNANIVLIHVFKDYCALLFFKGSLLNDPEGILIQQTKQTFRQRARIRFTNVRGDC